MLNLFVSTLSIYIVVPLVMNLIATKAEQKSDDDNVIKYPLLFCMIVAVGVAIINFSMIMGTVEFASGEATIKPTAAIILLSLNALFCLVGFLELLLIINSRVVFDSEELVHRNFLGIKRVYKYSQITRIKVFYEKKTDKPKSIKIFVDNKKISIEYLMTNFIRAERIIKNRLKKAGNSVKIESINKHASPPPV